MTETALRSPGSRTQQRGPVRRKKRLPLSRPVLYLVLILGAVPTILPFIWLLRSAFMSSGQIFVSPPQWIPHPWEWSNFSGALTAVTFGQYFINTLIIEVFVVIGTVLSCAVSAFSFARLRWRGRNVVFAVILTSLMLPYAVTLIPTFMAWQKLGAVNTFVPLIVPAFVTAGGVFNIFLMRQFFLTIPYELDEAAYIDGASPLQVFWTITIPLSRPVLVVVTLFTFVGVWNDFLNPLIYLNDSSKFTLTLGLASFQSIYNAQWGYLMAASSVVIAPIIALFFFAQRYFIEGITLTGIKG
jgi:multiple sugar transport system permease protein